MKLNDWLTMTGKTAYIDYNGERGIVCIPDFSDESRPLLWDLDDYLVSSVSGGAIWLYEKTSIED